MRVTKNKLKEECVLTYLLSNTPGPSMLTNIFFLGTAPCPRACRPATTPPHPRLRQRRARALRGLLLRRLRGRGLGRRRRRWLVLTRLRTTMRSVLLGRRRRLRRLLPTETVSSAVRLRASLAWTAMLRVARGKLISSRRAARKRVVSGCEYEPCL